MSLIKDIILTVITLLLIAVIVVVLNKESSRDQDLQRVNSDLEVKTSAYRQEKKELQDELNALRSQKIEKEKGISSLMLVFSSVNESFLQEIVPFLDENNCVATLCLTDSVFESVPTEEIQRLVNKGWQTSLYWDGYDDFGAWLSNTVGTLSSTGIPIPDMICVDVNSYDTTFDNLLVENGFQTLIINLGASNIYVDNDDNRLIKINGHSWYTTSSAACLSSNEFYDSQLAFFVGTEGVDLAYETNQFSAMINSALSKQVDSKIIITTPRGALSQSVINKAEYENALSGYDARVEELEKAIDEIDEKINSVYASYN